MAANPQELLALLGLAMRNLPFLADAGKGIQTRAQLSKHREEGNQRVIEINREWNLGTSALLAADTDLIELERRVDSLGNDIKEIKEVGEIKELNETLSTLQTKLQGERSIVAQLIKNRNEMIAQKIVGNPKSTDDLERQGLVGYARGELSRDKNDDGKTHRETEDVMKTANEALIRLQGYHKQVMEFAAEAKPMQARVATFKTTISSDITKLEAQVKAKIIEIERQKVAKGYEAKLAALQAQLQAKTSGLTGEASSPVPSAAEPSVTSVASFEAARSTAPGLQASAAASSITTAAPATPAVDRAGVAP